MDWIKIPIDDILFTERKEWQTFAIIKYQALYSQLEIKPNEIQLKRILTKREYVFIEKNHEIVDNLIEKAIKSTENKRKSEKIRYNKIKDLDKNLQADCKQTASSPREQVRLDKIRLDKIREDIGEKSKRFIPPTIDEVTYYCQERNNGIDAQRFIDFYSARGWIIGKNKMKDWRAAVRTWEGKNKQDNKKDDIVWTRPSDGWTFTAEEFKKQYGRNFGE